MDTTPHADLPVVVPDTSTPQVAPEVLEAVAEDGRRSVNEAYQSQMEHRGEAAMRVAKLSVQQKAILRYLEHETAKREAKPSVYGEPRWREVAPGVGRKVWESWTPTWGVPWQPSQVIPGYSRADAASLSRSVRQLERRGLVRRRAPSWHSLGLTEAGRAVAKPLTSPPSLLTDLRVRARTGRFYGRRVRETPQRPTEGPKAGTEANGGQDWWSQRLHRKIYK
jgi:hypothetical protein